MLKFFKRMKDSFAADDAVQETEQEVSRLQLEWASVSRNDPERDLKRERIHRGIEGAYIKLCLHPGLIDMQRDEYWKRMNRALTFVDSD